MHADDIRWLFAYDRWATRRVLDVLDGLEASVWERPNVVAERGLGSILVHHLGASQRWRIGLDPVWGYAVAALLAAQLYAESGFNPFAVSPAGAAGINDVGLGRSGVAPATSRTPPLARASCRAAFDSWYCARTPSQSIATLS